MTETKIAEPRTTVPRRRLALVIGLAAALWSVVVIVAVFATRLRPLGDDYCHGSTATVGYFPSLVVWYTTWIGDLFQVSVTALLVGQPLALLPFEVASAIPFLATAAAVTTLAVVAIGPLSGSRTTKRLAWLVVVPLVLVTWWGYWWAPVDFDGTPASTPWQLATATLHWQTVNVQYALVPAVLVAAWLYLRRTAPSRVWLRTGLFGVLGALCGMGGLAFGAAALGFVLILVVASLVRTGRRSLRHYRNELAFAVLCVGGLAVAYFSPGTRSRGEILAQNPPLDSVTPWRLFGWIFPEGIHTWTAGIFTVGTLVAVMVAAGGGVLFQWMGIATDRAHLVRVGGGVLGMSLLVALAARGAEAFSYQAPWHEVTPRTLVFVSAILLGFAGGLEFAARTSRWGTTLIPVVAGICLAVALGSLFTMQYEILDRYATWIAGPAPSSTGDIDVQWIRNCWDVIAEFRTVPDRS